LLCTSDNRIGLRLVKLDVRRGKTWLRSDANVSHQKWAIIKLAGGVKTIALRLYCLIHAACIGDVNKGKPGEVNVDLESTAASITEN
jgi:hypothetical protein